MKTLMTVATLSAGLLFAPGANATLMLSLDVGGTLFSCVDNTACDTNAAVGVLQVANQTINNVTFNGSIQSSTGTTNTPGTPTLNTSSLSIINGNATDISLAAAIGDTNFIGPANQFFSSVSATFQNAVGSTFTYNFYDDPTNQQGAQATNDTPGTQIDTSTKTVTLIADSFAHTATGSVTDPGLFSMTESIFGTLIANGQIINNGQTEIKNAIPEPTSLAMLGLGCVALGFLRRKRNV